MQKYCSHPAAIVIITVEFQGHWKISVGYYLISGISAELQSYLVLLVISSVHDVKVNILALVLHGKTINKQKVVKFIRCKITPDTIDAIFHIFWLVHIRLNVYIFFDEKKVMGTIACPTRDSKVG